MWIKDHDLPGIDLFGHSHGVSVMMLASHDEPALGELVLLGCPVHVPKYFPDFSRVTKVVSIRVRLDLVILADGGGQHFNNPRIEENVLPIWFDHSRTHDPRDLAGRAQRATCITEIHFGATLRGLIGVAVGVLARHRAALGAA